MHCQNDARLHLLALQTCMSFDHSQLHQVSGAALQGSIHRLTLSPPARGGVAAVTFRNRSQPAKHRPYLSRFARLLNAPPREFIHFPIPLEVFIDISLSLGLACAGPLRQPEGTQTIDHAIINGLGQPSMLVSLKRRGHTEDFLGSAGMNVFILRESFN